MKTLIDIVSFNTLWTGFNSDRTQILACYNARFQTRFSEAPPSDTQRGVLKIGHRAETRIITGRIRLSQELTVFFLESL